MCRWRVKMLKEGDEEGRDREEMTERCSVHITYTHV